MFLLILGMFNVHAQDDGVDPASDGPEQQQTTSEETGQDQAAEVITPDIFDPTEKLIEDIPYEFPTDI